MAVRRVYVLKSFFFLFYYTVTVRERKKDDKHTDVTIKIQRHNIITQQIQH